MPVSIAASDRIPFLQKIMFSTGAATDWMTASLVTSILWMPYFNIGLGYSPAVLGMILMILRGWDAFVDPVMGNFSDNFRTRWGRRRPFLVVGSILMATVFPWIWRIPPHLSEEGKVVYLIIMGMIYFVCYSTWSMPYYALQMELTPNYDERTRLTAWMTLFGKIVSLAGGWVPALLMGSWFADPATGKSDFVHGVQVGSWYMAAFLLATGLLAPLFVRERYYEKESSHQAREPFWKSIKDSVHCRPLWFLIGTSFFLVLGSVTSSALGQYINIYYVNGGQLKHSFTVSGWISSATFLPGILSLPLWTWLGEKFDKKIMVGLLIGGSAFGHFLNYFCLRPDMPYLQMIPALFLSMAVSAIWLFLPSMKSDVADYDEQDTLRRREGSLNAFYSWFVKASGTVGAGLGGVLIQLSGFNAKLGAQTHEVLLRMRLIYLALPILFWIISMIFLYYYPLNRPRMAKIRAELETRRGKM